MKYFESQSQNGHEKENATFLPVAYLDDISGRKIVARVGSTDQFILLVPPNFEIEDALRGDWVLDAAVGKQRFNIFNEPQEHVDIVALRANYAKRSL